MVESALVTIYTNRSRLPPARILFLLRLPMLEGLGSEFMYGLVRSGLAEADEVHSFELLRSKSFYSIKFPLFSPTTGNNDELVVCLSVLCM
ncbi:hypothetical protein L6452_03294 [Arctium lappa]|uniref:Uncharacterized protein n=1 Tax=Arctium lappa TaxID=4217 RepID=A0ACB9FL99_ARCLA|nr:hypothetical protein L6452_03294 [Arctium lappa]